MSTLTSDASGPSELLLEVEVTREKSLVVQEDFSSPPQAPLVVPRQSSTGVGSHDSLARVRILSGLLRMADTYRAEGALRQALEMYFELTREHDGTPHVLVQRKWFRRGCSSS